MSTPAPAHLGSSRRGALVRPVDGRVIGGVCVGIANHLGIATVVVRVIFVLATVLASGTGFLVYVVLWALLPQEGGPRDAQAQASSTARETAHIGGKPRLSAREQLRLDDAAASARRREHVRVLIVGLVLVGLGAGQLLDRTGVGWNSRLWVPILVLAVGIGIGLTQLDDVESNRWLGTLGGRGWAGLARLGGGAALSVVGLLMLVLPQLQAAQVTTVLIAALAVILGIGVVLAPWGLRMWHDLEAERALRVREAQRAEITAHLHDSVLQTLALIQRKPDDPVQVARLARAQERELRQWLYGAETAADSASSVAEEVRRSCAEIEDAEGVPVEVILVGDADVDEPTAAMLQAIREAVSNAVRHGKEGVSVYVECTPVGVEAFIRDRGPGIDLDAIPLDRFGVRGSIIDRMERNGGTAQVRAAPGGGTEVSLRLTRAPRSGADVGNGKDAGNAKVSNDPSRDDQ